jgi:hypothetical protein
MIKDYHARIVVEDTPFRYYREIQTDVVNESIVDPATPAIPVRDFVVEECPETIPTAVAVLLQITTNVGSAIVNDLTNIVADPAETKFVRVSVIRDDGTGALEVLVEEKTTGVYAGVPVGKTLEQIINEFSVVAAGTDLVEV